MLRLLRRSPPDIMLFVIMNSSRILFCLTACAFLNAAPREIIQLSAGWSFQMDVSDIGEKEQWYGKNFDRSAWAKVSVPKAWDLYDEALWAYEGIGWYTIRIAGRIVARRMKEIFAVALKA